MILLMKKIASEGVIYTGLALITVLAIPICLFGLLAVLVWEATETVVRYIEKEK